MCGLSGSGKTTLSKQKLKVNEAAGVKTSRFSTDDLFFRPDGTWVFEKEKLAEHHRVTLERAVGAMRDGHPVVIVDNTNILRRHRKPYIDEGRRFGYRVECVVVGDFTDDFAKFCARRSTHLPASEAVSYNTTMARRFEEPDPRFTTRIDKMRLGWTPDWCHK
jgi:tRNA uridine 5-carbamoylmethylation protein Kti12